VLHIDIKIKAMNNTIRFTIQLRDLIVKS